MRRPPNPWAKYTTRGYSVITAGRRHCRYICALACHLMGTIRLKIRVGLAGVTCAADVPKSPSETVPISDMIYRRAL